MTARHPETAQGRGALHDGQVSVLVRDEDQVAAGTDARGEEDGLAQRRLDSGRQRGHERRVGRVAVEAIEEEAEDCAACQSAKSSNNGSGGRGTQRTEKGMRGPDSHGGPLDGYGELVLHQHIEREVETCSG